MKRKINMEAKLLEMQAILTREKEEKETLKKELQHLKLFYSELTSTSNHPVAVTLRERELKKKLVETIAELNLTKIIVETQNKQIEERINENSILYLLKNATRKEFSCLSFYVPAADCNRYSKGIKRHYPCFQFKLLASLQRN